MLFVAFGLLMAGSGLKQAITFRDSPLRSFRAAVIDERVKVSGGGSNSMSHTYYYATLQVPDGERTEFQVDDDIASKVYRALITRRGNDNKGIEFFEE